jgi:hypothetical protein
MITMLSVSESAWWVVKEGFCLVYWMSVGLRTTDLRTVGVGI